MEIIKGDFSATKGIPPSGLCVGVHRAGAIHQKMVAKYGDHLAVWSLRPDLDFIAFKKEGLNDPTCDREGIGGEDLEKHPWREVIRTCKLCPKAYAPSVNCFQL